LQQAPKEKLARQLINLVAEKYYEKYPAKMH